MVTVLTDVQCFQFNSFDKGWPSRSFGSLMGLFALFHIFPLPSATFGLSACLPSLSNFEIWLKNCSFWSNAHWGWLARSTAGTWACVTLGIQQLFLSFIVKPTSQSDGACSQAHDWVRTTNDDDNGNNILLQLDMNHAPSHLFITRTVSTLDLVRHLPITDWIEIHFLEWTFFVRSSWSQDYHTCITSTTAIKSFICPFCRA